MTTGTALRITQPVSASLGEDVTELLLHGHTTLGVSDALFGPAITAIIDGARLITDEPLLQKEFAGYIIGQDEVGWSVDVGVFERDDNERKACIHVLQRDQRWDRAPSELRPFVDASLEMIENGMARMTRFANALDDTWADINGSPPLLAPKFKRGWGILRILRYREPRPGFLDAEDHIDRSALTQHVYASHPGLHVYGRDRERVHVPTETDSGYVTIFTGKKFGAVTRGCLPELVGTVHGVDDRRFGEERSEDRYVVVLFGHPALEPDDILWLQANSRMLEERVLACAT